MPLKPMNARAMMPVIISVIGAPLKPSGMELSFSFDLIPAIAVMARAHPIPEPTENINV
ncbi:hypothetical protein DSECCO2_633160 [anaerobic digester metagenome]